METLRIESIAYRGAGVARAADGAVCFVPGTCPGELVEAERAEERRTFRRMRLARVLEPSPDRLAAPECLLPDGSPVPGCVYGHARHEAELAWKNAQLRGFLVRQAGLAGAGERLEEPFASPAALHYRNKCVLHAAPRRALGYFGEDNETVVDVPSCPLSVAPIDAELASMRADEAFWRYAVPGSEVGLRWTEADGTVVWVDRPRDRGRRPEALPDLTEQTPILGRMRVPARGFWQMNGAVGGALVSAVADLLREAAPARLLDLYCGVGVFGLCCLGAGASSSARLTGIESGRQAIDFAKRNSANQKYANVKFWAERVGQNLRRISVDSRTTVIVDPPRAGMEPNVPRWLAASKAPRILYVSCDPATLTRDLKTICLGYDIESVRWFNMFPRTARFETLVVLKRKTGD